VLESALRLLAIVATFFVVASFGLFARDQFSGASRNQQQEIVAGEPHVPIAVAEKTHHGQPRRFIDDAASRLENPFDGLVSSSSDWAKQGVPALLAVLVYGAGLGFVARYARGRP
jgi:hypothetical protein